MHAESIYSDATHSQHGMLHWQDHPHDGTTTKKFPTIMLAEDDNPLRELLSEQLRQDGCEVVQAWDGASFLDYVHDCVERSQHPDMLITDLHMPEYPGWEIVPLLQSLGWYLPVIVITGFADVRFSSDAWQSDVAAVFHKPFDLNTLRCTIHNCLRQATTQTRLYGKRTRIC